MEINEALNNLITQDSQEQESVWTQLLALYDPMHATLTQIEDQINSQNPNNDILEDELTAMQEICDQMIEVAVFNGIFSPVGDPGFLGQLMQFSKEIKEMRSDILQGTYALPLSQLQGTISGIFEGILQG